MNLNLDSQDKFHVCWEALTQYYEQMRDAVDARDPPNPEHIRKRDCAEALVGVLDAHMAALAEPKTASLSVVRYNDLPHSHLHESYDSVSYGDAEYTLVAPAQLIAELEKVGGRQPLVDELKRVPVGVLVALEG